MLGRVLRKFEVLEGVLARVLLLIPFQGKPPSQHPRQHPEFSRHSSQRPAQLFSGFPILYSVAGRPDLKAIRFDTPFGLAENKASAISVCITGVTAGSGGDREPCGEVP